MKVFRTQSSLIVRERAVVFPLLFGGFALFMMVKGVPALAHGDPALVIGALMMTVGAVAFFEVNQFRFDSATRELIWQRQTALRRTGGRMPFSAVTRVWLDLSAGGDGAELWRIVLDTKEGPLPLTRAYGADEDTCRNVAEQILEALGRAPVPSNTVDALVRSGRTIDAVRALRAGSDLSLTAAKAAVDGRRRTP